MPKGTVEDKGCWCSEQDAGGVACMVTDDLSAGRVRSVFCVAESSNGGSVENRRLIQVQHQHRGIGSSGVQFRDSW